MNLEQQGPRVDISATTPIVCECGNDTFTDKMYLRKESRLMSGLSEDRLVPIQLVVCERCGIAVEDFIAAPLKQFYGKDANKSI